MSPGKLQQYLHDHIPLSKAMQITVERISPESVTLSAPLAPNINHRDTLFGGSASTAAILAAWSFCATPCPTTSRWMAPSPPHPS